MTRTPEPAFKRREKDAERKRQARARARSSVPQECDFGKWLRARAAELPALKRAWSDMLAEAMDEGLEYDRLLRRYATGDVTPKPEAAYRIGEGLRSLGHPWACGVLAVYATGALPYFYAFVGSLTVRPSLRRVAACLALVAGATGSYVGSEPIPGFLSGNRFLSVVTSNAERLDEAWRSCNPATSRPLLSSPIELALMVAEAKTLSFFDREMIIARLLRSWAMQNDFHDIVDEYDEGDRMQNRMDRAFDETEHGITP